MELSWEKQNIPRESARRALQTVTSPIVLQPSPIVYYMDSFSMSLISNDFNKDGHWDLANTIYEDNTVLIWLGIGNGTFRTSPMIFFTNATYAYRLISQDFNNDGNVDLAIASEGSGTVSILLGQGNGSFQQPAMTFLTGGSLSPSVIAADVNNDGKIDLAVTNVGSTTLAILLGMGNGSFLAPILFTTLSLPTALVSGDFNIDGNIDIAVTNRFSTQMLIFLGFGNGSFYTNFTGYFTDYYCYSVKTADFNGDSKLDLATINSWSNTLNIFLGTGAGTFVMTSPASYAIGPSSYEVELQDMNEDSIVDVILSTGATNGISIFLGNGDGTFQPAQGVWTGAQGVGSFAIQDFNEDGRYDLAVMTGSNNTIGIVLS